MLSLVIGFLLCGKMLAECEAFLVFNVFEYLYAVVVKALLFSLYRSSDCLSLLVRDQ